MEEKETTLKRFDYAWDWFKVHAKQRTDMFNYFLLTTGLLANAYVNLRKEGHWVAAGAVAITGLFTSFGFSLLDVRNKFLVDKAAYVLDETERELLFCTETMKDKGLSQVRLDRTKPNKSDFINNLYRHGTVFRTLHIIVALMWLVFLGGVILFWLRSAGYVINIKWETAMLLFFVQVTPAFLPVILVLLRRYQHRIRNKQRKTK